MQLLFGEFGPDDVMDVVAAEDGSNKLQAQFAGRLLGRPKRSTITAGRSLHSAQRPRHLAERTGEVTLRSHRP